VYEISLNKRGECIIFSPLHILLIFSICERLSQSFVIFNRILPQSFFLFLIEKIGLYSVVAMFFG
jgi:hypothetical protein